MEETYDYIIVESVLTNERGKHGPIHIRPIANQAPYLESMYVQCSKTMSDDYPLGTRFRIKAHYTWPYEVLTD
jgi:hypothetical protein